MTRLLFRGISTSKLTPDFDVVAMRGRAASLLISGQELHKVLMISCFFFFFYGRPTLLSLIAARSVQQHFYERLPPINLPLIPHMKVMSLLMVTEVWSVSLIEIALHLGGNKHYSFMFPKAECGFWIRRARVIWLAYTSNVVICGMWFEAWAFSYSTTLLRVLYLTLLLDFTKLAICNYSRVLNWTKPSASVNRRGKRSQVLNVA